jgi:DNA recombination protein RmuC
MSGLLRTLGAHTFSKAPMLDPWIAWTFCFLLGAALGTAAATWSAFQSARRRDASHGDAVRSLEHALQRETTARAVAEERATRVGRVEQQLLLKEELLESSRQELSAQQRRNAELQTALEKGEELREKLLEAQAATEKQLSERFGALSREALTQSTATLLELARAELGKLQASSKSELDTRHARFEELVKPFKEALDKLDGKVHDLEKLRLTAYDGLVREVTSLRQTQELARTETGNLVKALRRPNVRGLWGEMQLRRVVEMALMEKHCSFVEQETHSHEGKTLRPDLIIRLPGGKQVIVDAKTPCAAYLDALEAPDETERATKLKDHARQVADKVNELASKEYAQGVDGALELVVLFLPAEAFLSAAFEQDPLLLEHAFRKNIILATPMTLMALLKTIAQGWKQNDIAQHAEEVASLASQLYERLCTLGERFGAMGAGLKKAVHAYNETVGCLESRVLPTARRFKELNTVKSDKHLEELSELHTLPRPLQSEELLDRTAVLELVTAVRSE